MLPVIDIISELPGIILAVVIVDVPELLVSLKLEKQIASYEVGPNVSRGPVGPVGPMLPTASGGPIIPFSPCGPAEPISPLSPLGIIKSKV